MFLLKNTQFSQIFGIFFFLRPQKFGEFPQISINYHGPAGWKMLHSSAIMSLTKIHVNKLMIDCIPLSLDLGHI